MSIKQGKILKNIVALGDSTAQQIAKKLDISRGQLYNLYNMDVIPDYYIEKLKSIGIKLDNHPNVVNEPTEVYSKDGGTNEVELLRIRVEYLEKINQLLEKQVLEYEKQIKMKK